MSATAGQWRWALALSAVLVLARVLFVLHAERLVAILRNAMGIQFRHHH